MVDKRIIDLPEATSALGNEVLALDGATTRKITTDNLLKENLTAFKNSTSLADRLFYFTGPGTGALAAFTSFARTLLDDPDAATARVTLGLAIGTNVQAYDPNLAAIAAQSTAADKLFYFTGNGAGTLTDFTSFGRSVVSAVNAAAARAALGSVIGTDVQAYNANLTGFAGKTVPAGGVVGTSDTQTLTNKTLTSPAITSPTGLVRADVGLSNVDNTSDATKNASAATLTNKTLTAPIINSPTGIVKGDVGLGNVDNTSDATKFAAAKTLTNTTFDTAGTGNVLRVNGTQISAVTGTGSAVLASAATLTNPVVGTQTIGDNSTKAASTAFVQAAISAGTAGVASVGGSTGIITLRGGNLPAQELTAIRFDAAQILTQTEMQQARKNAGINGILFASDYGVTGDGTTDDTAALQAFLTALSASPYSFGVLAGKSGVFFKTSAALSLSSGAKVVGGGWNTEVRPSHNGAAFRTSGTASVGANAIFLSDFAIVGKSASITAISKANPAVVTCAGGHPFVNGETIQLINVGGMTQVNSTHVAPITFTIAGATSTTFQLSGINSTAYGTYTSGGDVIYDGSIGTDLRYANACRLKNIKVSAQQTAFFKYTNSGTVGCYYNVLEDCQASSCVIGDMNFTGANSNLNRGFRTVSTVNPIYDAGNANQYDVLAAEIFTTLVDAFSGSSGSWFKILRAENVGNVGTVFNIRSGVTDANIPIRPYVQAIGAMLADAGTRTLFEGVQTISASVTFPVMAAQTGNDQAIAVSGAFSGDTFVASAPSSLPVGMTYAVINSSSQFYIRGIQFAASASSSYSATWIVRRHRALS